MFPNTVTQPTNPSGFGSNSSTLQNQSNSNSTWSHLLYHINQTVEKVPNKIDLNDLIKNDLSTSYSAKNPWQGPKLVKQVNLEVHSLPQQSPISANFKYSPEIGKVFAFHDSFVKFWNPIDGKLVYEFQEPSQNNIKNASIVPTNSSVFNDYFSNLLVTCTQDKLAIYGIQLTNGNIRLINTHVNYKISNEQCFASISCDPESKRLFFAGSEGFIYELIYNLNEGTFVNGTKLKRLTGGSYLSNFINPPKISSAIVEMVIDESRRLLYTLHKCSSVEVYSLGTKDKHEFQLITQLVDLKKLAAERYPQSPYTSTQLPQQIQSIHVVPLSQSSTINLVAFSRLGHRIYLQLSENSGLYSSDHVLKVAFIKIPPATSLNIPSNPRSSTFFNHGVSVMYGGSHSHPGTLVITYPLGKLNSYNFSSSTSTHQSWETCEIIDMGSEFDAWEIYELPTKMLTKLFPPASETSNNAVESTSWGIQLFSPPRHFMVVSHGKICYFALPRPIDQLAQILNQDPPSKAILDQFISFYGSPFTTTMSLALLNHKSLSYSSHLVGDYDPSSSALDDKVVKLFFDMSEKSIPLYASLSSATHYPHIEVIGKPLPSLDQVSFKEKLHGITLYLIQILSPIWRKSLIKHDKLKKEAIINEWMPTQVRDQLQEFLEILKKIESYYTESAYDRTPNERAYFFEVKKLTNFVLEISELFILISSHLNMEEVRWDWSILSQENPTLATTDELQLDMLVTTPLGKDILNQLTYWFAHTSALLFDIQKSNLLVDVLANKCSLLYPVEALTILQAEQYLQLAINISTQMDQSVKMEYLQQCLRYLTQPKSNLSSDRLCYFVQQLINLDFFDGAIDLVLFHANKVAVSSSSNQYDSVPPHVSIYRVLFTTLKSMENCPNYKSLLNDLCLKCPQVEDQYFHNLIYEYLLENQMNLLLSMDTTTLVPYLSSLPTSVPKLEALIYYYRKKSNFQKASNVYSQLAYDTSLDIAIEKRVEYLVFAVSYLRRIYPDNTNAIINDRLSELEYAMKIGRIQLQLYDSVPYPFRNPTRMPPHQLLSAEVLMKDYMIPQRQYIALFNLLEATNQKDTSLIREMWQACIHDLHQFYTDSPFEKVQMGIQIIYNSLSTNSPLFPPPMINHILLNYHRLQSEIIPDLWVWGTLESCGFELEAVLLYWEGLRIGKLSPWNEDSAMQFLSEQIELLKECYKKKYGNAPLNTIQGETILDILFKESSSALPRLPSKRSAEDDLDSDQPSSKLV